MELSAVRFQDLTALPFRANPAYELVLFDRLPPEQSGGDVLEALRRDPSFYGVLRPRQEAPGLGLKSVDRETALLFLTLREPGPLPGYVRAVFGEGAARAILRLLAEGVLEVEHGGTFVGGPAALGRLAPGAAAGVGRGRLAELSVAALRHAQRLPLEDPLELSFRLYSFHRRPLTPGWRRRLGSPQAVDGFLGVSGIAGWEPLQAARSDGWRSWRLRGSPRSSLEAAFPASAPTYKLYVSPIPEALPETFPAAAAALAAARALSFKVGADAAGLLRPDKLVAYFPDFDSLAGAAGLLAERLAGIPPHGVPFTAEIGGDGLLSWGMDPPRREGGLGPRGEESWRLWLTHRLARALLAPRAEKAGDETGGPAGAATGGEEPWRLALERLRLEGVSTETWTPGPLLWRET